MPRVGIHNQSHSPQNTAMSGSSITGILARLTGREPVTEASVPASQRGYDPLHAPVSKQDARGANASHENGMDAKKGEGNNPPLPSKLDAATAPTAPAKAPVSAHSLNEPKETQVQSGAGGQASALGKAPSSGQHLNAAQTVSPSPYEHGEASGSVERSDEDDRLDALIQNLSHLQQIAGPGAHRPVRNSNSPDKVLLTERNRTGRWYPIAPTNLDEAGLFETDVEGLILKFLNHRGEANGREIAAQVRLPFAIIESILAHMKADQRVYYRGSAAMNDYVYQLTENGRIQARSLADVCTYFGSAPVSLKDYSNSVAEQSLTKLHPSQEDVAKAFSDLILDPDLVKRLGPAINSGRGLFLYGYPGNGKTSVAERITLSFGETIWIPRALYVDGEIVRLYDPGHHIEVPPPKDETKQEAARVDQRWVRVKRPTIVVGGELTMDQLEITFNRNTGLSEAPFQMKSNCGTLVIDDFGRQKMRTDELLNRWIVPLEKRYDFLNLASGKKIQVPFDQLVVFSTNLEPKDLVDEAFLRRIPYKIHVPDPSEAHFRQLFNIFAKKMEIRVPQGAVDYLVETHYRQASRPFRGCHPRDLLTQIKNLCVYTRQPLEATVENLDFAVDNYFSMM